LSHVEWDLEVTSGEADYNQILAEYDQARSDLEDLLKKLNVKSLEEAEAVNKAYEGQAAKVENAQSMLQEDLGESKYEDLKKRAKGVKVQKPTRELETILNELAETKAEISGLKTTVADLKERLGEYAQEYVSHKKLVEKLGDIGSASKKNEEELSGLKPLPADVKDAAEFISRYEEIESRLRESTAEHNQLIQERIRLEAKSPDRSVEEFERDLAEAEEKFDREHKKGMAIARIKETTEELLTEMDSTTFEGLEKDISGLMQRMTGGRYKTVEMDEIVPSGFHRKDGVIMPYDNLSTGTKDVLGIALRLAITKRFLEYKEGFVIMDDPLVDLDPNRQSKAAEAIKDFAEEKQLIVLTCHPSHAKLLGGNHIQLYL
jgi:exonuclease SbcC